MWEILQYPFFQNALLGSLLASILCAIVGTYIVSRRLVFISGGITHASFGGIGLGVYFGLNPILSAMAFAVASALGVEWMSRKGLPVLLVEYGLMALVAMTIVATLRMVGIVLAISLLTIPQMTANLLTSSFKRIIFWSMLIGWVDCLVGLAISYYCNVPSGASIIFVSIVIYAIVKAIKWSIKRF